METNVFKLEGGNYEFDDSEIKQSYDNQKQLNTQLQEQKRWLEHELEEVNPQKVGYKTVKRRLEDGSSKTTTSRKRDRHREVVVGGK